jgi:hypothetical protein
MAQANLIKRGLKAVWNFGVTPEVRPEEVKHIRWLNIGMLLYGLINLI